MIDINDKNIFEKTIKLSFGGEILRIYRISNFYNVNGHIFFNAFSNIDVYQLDHIFYPLSVINDNDEMKLNKNWYECSEPMCKKCYMKQYFLLKGDGVDVVLVGDKHITCFGEYHFRCMKSQNSKFTPQLFCNNQYTQDELHIIRKHI